jgi:hypothetical protein
LSLAISQANQAVSSLAASMKGVSSLLADDKSTTTTPTKSTTTTTTTTTTTATTTPTTTATTTEEHDDESNSANTTPSALRRRSVDVESPLVDDDDDAPQADYRMLVWYKTGQKELLVRAPALRGRYEVISIRCFMLCVSSYQNCYHVDASTNQSVTKEGYNVTRCSLEWSKTSIYCCQCACWLCFFFTSLVNSRLL